MIWEGQYHDWDYDFFYPAVFFNSIDTVRLNQMHC